MDFALMVYILIATMAASGGVLGAFWLRALTIMRRRIIDSAEEVEQLTNAITELRGQIEGLAEDSLEVRERIASAERLLHGGDPGLTGPTD